MLGKSVKKRVFICYDIVNDARLLEFVTKQSRQSDSPFMILEHSRKWEPPESEWREKLKKTLAWAELMFIMVGKKTFKSANVNEEVDMAYKLGKPIMQFCDPDAKFAECKALPKAGKLYKWEWENLKEVMNKLQYIP